MLGGKSVLLASFSQDVVIQRLTSYFFNQPDLGSVLANDLCKSTSV
jgi:hypothetical protein